MRDIQLVTIRTVTTETYAVSGAFSVSKDDLLQRLSFELPICVRPESTIIESVENTTLSKIRAEILSGNNHYVHIAAQPESTIIEVK